MVRLAWPRCWATSALLKPAARRALTSLFARVSRRDCSSSWARDGLVMILPSLSNERRQYFRRWGIPANLDTALKNCTHSQPSASLTNVNNLSCAAKSLQSRQFGPSTQILFHMPPLFLDEHRGLTLTTQECAKIRLFGGPGEVADGKSGQRVKPNRARPEGILAFHIISDDLAVTVGVKVGSRRTSSRSKA